MNYLSLDKLVPQFYFYGGNYEEYGYDNFLNKNIKSIKTVLITGYCKHEMTQVANSIYGCLRDPQYGAQSPRLIDLDMRITESKVKHDIVDTAALLSSIETELSKNEDKNLYTVVFGTSNSSAIIINSLMKVTRSTVILYPDSHVIKNRINSFNTFIVWLKYYLFGPFTGVFGIIMNKIIEQDYAYNWAICRVLKQ